MYSTVQLVDWPRPGIHVQFVGQSEVEISQTILSNKPDDQIQESESVSNCSSSRAVMRQATAEPEESGHILE